MLLKKEKKKKQIKAMISKKIEIEEKKDLWEPNQNLPLMNKSEFFGPNTYSCRDCKMAFPNRLDYKIKSIKSMK